MRFRARRLTSLLPALLPALVPAAACAQAWPAKPIRIVVPFTAGGSVDVMARLVGQKLNEFTGQPVVVENRAGASAMIGAEFVVRSAPDGYTIFATPSPIYCVNPVLLPKPAYDPYRDLAPVSLGVLLPVLLVVHPSLPVTSVGELIRFAKARKGEIAYASAGNGTTPHLAGEAFKFQTGVSLVHVPYKGGAPGVMDTIAGQTALMFSVLPDSIQFVRAGKLRGVAVAAATRSAAAPAIPTFDESGLKGFLASTWYAFDVPAATPKDVVAKLGAEIGKAFRHPDVSSKMKDQGFEVIGSTPEYYASWIKSDCQRVGRIIKDAAIRMD